MLDRPLRFLSYLNLRARFGDKLLVPSELTVLSYHLKGNLWVDKTCDMLALSDDCTVDLDVAMMVRREGLPGKRTPDGILTRHQESAVGRIVQQIDARPDPVPIDLGLLLVQLDEDTVKELSSHIEKIRSQARKDLGSHDVTISIAEGSVGLTIHCNYREVDAAMSGIRRHCELRKYAQKADRWFGVLVGPDDGLVIAACKLDHPWAQDAKLDEATADMPRGILNRRRFDWRTGRKKKVGRNSPCTCGSGKKAKRCCFA